MTISDIPPVWLLKVGGKQNLSLSPNSLEYFQTHFVMEPMASGWKAQSFDILGKSKRLRDFVGLMNSVPVVSDRVRSLLEPLCQNDVEFLPIRDILGKPYFAMNVIRAEDVLDFSRCELTSTNDGKIVSIRRFAFRNDLAGPLAPVFKALAGTGDVFVTQSFVDVARANRFTGFALADPGVDNFARLLRGESLNVVPGIVE